MHKLVLATLWMHVHGCVHQHAYAVSTNMHTLMSTNIAYAAINACIDPHVYMCVCLLMLCACANLHVCTETVCVF